MVQLKQNVSSTQKKKKHVNIRIETLLIHHNSIEIIDNHWYICILKECHQLQGGAPKIAKLVYNSNN